MLRIVGISVPVLFVLERIAVNAYLGQPWTWTIADGELLGWVAVTLCGIAPFVVCLVAAAVARPAGLVWWTAVVYTVLAGAFGVWVDVDMLTLDDPLAALGLFFLIVCQWAVLLTVAVIVGVIAVVLHRRRERWGVPDDRETRRSPTGK
ncbi:hypothetical protein [Brevibacterium metallidurans]|uniref:Uncharacterized protein n=1 Tax=Brevibacterium metallidurans TaxID=1482676 RepID=A0ABP3C4M6_9MICO